AERARHRDARPADPVGDADRLARPGGSLAPWVGEARMARCCKAVVLRQRGIRRTAGRRNAVILAVARHASGFVAGFSFLGGTRFGGCSAFGPQFLDERFAVAFEAAVLGR